MITTLHPRGTTATAHTHGTERPGTESLSAVLNRAVTSLAHLDPDLLHANTAAGRAVVTLASIARSAAGSLGADPGPFLTSGPGVVVVRDLVAAVQLFDRAAHNAAVEDSFVDAAQTAYVSLLAAL